MHAEDLALARQHLDAYSGLEVKLDDLARTIAHKEASRAIIGRFLQLHAVDPLVALILHTFRRVAEVISVPPDHLIHVFACAIYLALVGLPTVSCSTWRGQTKED